MKTSFSSIRTLSGYHVKAAIASIKPNYYNAVNAFYYYKRCFCRG